MNHLYATCIRYLCNKYNASGMILTSSDEFRTHQLPDSKNRLKKIIGFGGSNGIAILSTNCDKNIFLTDGRYILEAFTVLDKSFKVIEYSGDNFKNALSGYKNIICIQDFTTVLQYQEYEKITKCTPINVLEFDKIINEISRKDYVSGNEEKNHTPHIYDFKCALLSTKEKIKKITSTIPLDLNAIIITDTSCVSWILNIREDNYNTGVHNVNLLINRDGSYKTFYTPNELSFLSGLKIGCTYNETSLALYSVLLKNNTVVSFANPVHKLKAVKDKVEIDGFIDAHLHDGVAMVRFIAWFYENSYNNITELDCVDVLFDFRQRSQLFITNSFETICGFNQNGAIVHYMATKNTNKIILGSGVMLLDSGGHYKCGTTDVTRVFAIGAVDAKIKNHYTLVMKAHIALATAVFPVNTKANVVDGFARKVLWASQLDYKHGTGHGVGCYLNVHEYPSISQKSTDELVENMVVSIEPGLYFENEYGIRIENLYLITKYDEGYLTFKPLTMVPFDVSLLQIDQLTDFEKQWINDYHDSVYDALYSLLPEDERKCLKDIIIEI